MSSTQSSAATADGEGPLLRKKTDSVAAQVGKPGAQNGLSGKGKLGGSSNEGGLSGLLGSFGSGRTSAAPNDDPSGTPSPSPSEGGDPNYSASKSGSGQSGSASLFGDGGDELQPGGEGSQQLQFGAAVDANGIPVVGPGQTDPEDYFTRTHLNDNLFKVVEKRYQTKARDWPKP